MSYLILWLRKNDHLFLPHYLLLPLFFCASNQNAHTMKTTILFCIFLVCITTNLFAQSDTSAGTFWHPNPPNYTVKHAIEIESLVPMFFSGGYHAAIGYRYKRFRVRASIINGGTYNAETAGINNDSKNFKRYYTTSPGVFFGYNLWKNLELYSYLEFHTFRITQVSSGLQQDLKSTDTGLGLSYQFFYWSRFLHSTRGAPLCAWKQQCEFWRS